MTRDKSLWPTDDGPPRSFTEALTSDLVPNRHTCRPFLPLLEEAYAHRSHPTADCPGPISMAEVLALAFGEDVK